MRVLITNLLENEPFSAEIETSQGELLKALIPPGETQSFADIDPYFLNQYKPLRDQVFRASSLRVKFESEPDDLVGLPIATQIDTRRAARVATTADIVLSGLQTVDTVALQFGDRVLVKDQAVPSQNGIYEARIGPWARTTDACTSELVPPNMHLFVSEGATQADTFWQLDTDAPIDLGTTPLSFVMVTGAGGGEANTLVNAGAGGESLVASPAKIGLSLQVKSLAEDTDAIVTLTDVPASDRIDFGIDIDKLGDLTGSVPEVTTAEAITTGELLYFDTAGEVGLADADFATGKWRVEAVARETVGGSVLTPVTIVGKRTAVLFDAIPGAATNGSVVWLSQTAGRATLTPPFGPGTVRFSVGILIGADGASNPVDVIFRPQYISRTP